MVNRAIGIRHVIAVTAMVCATVQIISATWLVQNFDTPNVSTRLAKRLLAAGRYEVWSERLKGPDHSQSLLRSFHLPGEALYLAALFRVVPDKLHRYVHVPVTTTLVVSTACVASAIGGTSLGLLTGLFASVQPFVALHGPVWEDTFLAAALIWLAFALLSWRRDSSRGKSAVRALALFAISGWAAITRVEAQIMLLLLAGITFVVPAMRPLRREGLAICLGVLAALGLWGFRNRMAIGEFALGTSHDGVTFFWSNCAETRWALQYGQVEAVYGNREVMQPHWDRTAYMSEMEANRYYTGLAIRYILTHPADFVTTSVVKFFLSLLGISPEKPLTGARNLVAILNGIVVLALALRGLQVFKAKLSESTRQFWNWLFAVVTLPGLGILFIGPIGLRYYITFQAALWICAAGAILHFFGAAALKPQLPCD